MNEYNRILDGENLVSIIVPAYNVEKYIKKCVFSLQNQTYQDIEIIVVNDGSVDHTGIILDDLQRNDPRLKVVHKKNGGVSAARNSGIEISKGEFIVFVDGDDYVASDYIEYLLILARKTNADYCLSKLCYTQKDESQIKHDKIEVLSPADATALLLSSQVIVGCWNKIYKRSLLIHNKINFKPNLFYGEGLFFIITAAQLSNCVGVGQRKVYYYRRNHELSATTKFNIEKMRNGETALNLISTQLKYINPRVVDMLILHKSLFYLGAITRLLGNNCEKIFIYDYHQWLSYLRKNYSHIIFSKYISLYRKMLLLGGCISPRVMTKLDEIRRKYITEHSID